MKKIILTLIVLISFTSSSYAQDEKLIKISENKYQTIYGVKDSLETRNQYAKMWIIAKYKKGASKIIFQGRFPSMTSHAQQFAFDCEENKFISLSLDIYNKKGVVIYSEGESKIGNIIPESIGEVLRTVACYKYDHPEELNNDKSL